MYDVANFALVLSAGAFFGWVVVKTLRWITRDLAP
jgi:hypothetical protein